MKLKVILSSLASRRGGDLETWSHRPGFSADHSCSQRHELLRPAKIVQCCAVRCSCVTRVLSRMQHRSICELCLSLRGPRQLKVNDTLMKGTAELVSQHRSFSSRFLPLRCSVLSRSLKD